jgi:dTDP-4-dehydrorhamnose 3,5-epimerase
MAGLADRGVCPSVVDDQVGRLTFADDLADAVGHLLAAGVAPGTYNVTCAGPPASWADVAAAVFAARGRDPDDVRRVSTAQYLADKPGAAPRPVNSVLDLTRLEATGFRPRDWRTALDCHLAALPV